MTAMSIPFFERNSFVRRQLLHPGWVKYSHLSGGKSIGAIRDGVHVNSYFNSSLITPWWRHARSSIQYQVTIQDSRVTIDAPRTRRRYVISEGAPSRCGGPQ